MARNQFSFFATKADLESVLRAVESVRPLQFVVVGVFDSADVQSKHSLLGTPSIGTVRFADASNETRYLVAHRDLPIEIRTVPQRAGGVKFAIDQQANPQTIGFQPSGEFGEKCLIAGQVGTVSDHRNSLDLFREFSREFQRQFTKIKSYYVGKDALELLKKGWRLTSNAKSPPLYDLKLD
jgi:hypothetical protein